MELKDPKISILIGQESTTIEIYDSPSCTTFVRVKLTPDQLSSALSRLSHSPCECVVANLDRLGKTHEVTKFEFEMSETDCRTREKIAKETAERLCPEGWKSDGYFSSQDSFFTKDGKNMARATIRRWI